VFAQHFEKGGTILDIEASDVKTQFSQYYETGKSKFSNKKATAETVEASTPPVETAHAA
jgi:hypothetical protein